jgi:hypothetical protein
MKPFDIKKLKYDIDQVLGHFGLGRGTDCELLRTFVNVSIPPNFSLHPLMEEQRELLEKEGDVWNEEELKMHFLSFVFKFSDLQVPKKIKLFYERPLSGIVQDTHLSVICDALLAMPFGINTPKTPYFFLQEFKKGKKAQDDAEGQMLVAMLIAQVQNNNDNPIYGCYLQGRFWYFATLHQQQYCLSKAYDATQTDDLIQIIHILQNLKNIIKL